VYLSNPRDELKSSAEFKVERIVGEQKEKESYSTEYAGEAMMLTVTPGNWLET
jgi:hypothetical protein